MTHKTVKLRDILPNPFRRMNWYPIDEEKIERLQGSIDSTTFWDNLVARPSTKKGKYELAYGHHRLIALRGDRTRRIEGVYDWDHEIRLIVRDLDDPMMIKIMANENREEYDTNASVSEESVCALLEEFGKNPKKFPELGDFSEAPETEAEASKLSDLISAATGSGGNLRVNAAQVADFLGWAHSTVRFIFQSLRAKRTVGLPDQWNLEVGTKDALCIATCAQRIVKEFEKAGLDVAKSKAVAKKFAKKAAVEIKQGRWSQSNVKAETIEVLNAVCDSGKEMPMIQAIAKRWFNRIEKMVTDAEFITMVEYSSYLRASWRDSVYYSLKDLKKRCDLLMGRLTQADNHKESPKVLRVNKRLLLKE